MYKNILDKKHSQEYGFTLIELLVVILIIGVLASIAIPAFLNQRQRANDAAVLNDVRNVAAAIESEMIGNPHGSVAQVGATQRNFIRVGVGQLSSTNGQRVALSPGVNVKVIVWTSGQTFSIYAWHDNGKKYTSDTNGNRVHYAKRTSGYEFLVEYPSNG